MPYLPLNALLRPQSTAEEQNFLDQFYTKFDSGTAIHKKILNVEPLFYIGSIVGTEFLVYSANRIYICYDLIGLESGGNIFYIRLYDELNNAMGDCSNILPYYDSGATIVKYFSNPTGIKNIYFSRIDSPGYSHIKFNGYRVTLN